MKTKTLLSVFVALCLFGCKSTTGPTSSPNNFTIGDSSIYSYQTFDINGQQGATTYDTVSIVSTNTIGGKKQFVLSNGAIIVLDSNGAGTISEYIEADLLLAYVIPSRRGDTLFKGDTIPVKIGGVVGLAMLLLTAGNPDTVITVPAGVFHTAVFDLAMIFISDPTMRTTGKIFISPSEGIIQRESFTTELATKNLYLANLLQLKLLKKK